MSSFSNSITYSFGGAFSMGNSKRQQLYNTNSTPGPGTYSSENVIVNSPRQPQFVISKSPRRPIFEEKGIPPPGAYTFKSTIGNGQKVSISKYRYKEYGDKYDIGPGTYEVNKAFSNKQSSPHFSFSSRYEDLKPSFQTPGPGQYNMPDLLIEKLNQSKSTMSLYNSDTLKRVKSEDSLTPSTLPGPGEYYHDNSTQNSKGTTFAKSGRMMLKPSDTPGPGHFDVSSTLFNRSKNFTLGSKFSHKNTYQSSVPGPGTYDLSEKEKKPLIKMGGSNRTQLVMSDTPGPGSYLNHAISKDDSFAGQVPQNRGLGYSKRPDLVAGDRSPGPGMYNLPEYMGSSTHVKISTNVNKGKWKVKSEVPGPGQYNVNGGSIDLSKGARINGKRNDHDQSIQNPGPGSYDVSYIGVSPKYSFTQTKRSKQDIRQLFEPSPGQYEIAGTFANVPNYLAHKRS